MSSRASKVWLRRGVSFIGIPAILVLFAIIFGEIVLWFWLIVLAAYIALMSGLALTNQPGPKSEPAVKRIAGLLGSIVWGAFLLLLYDLLYIIFFHYRDLIAQ